MQQCFKVHVKMNRLAVQAANLKLHCVQVTAQRRTCNLVSWTSTAGMLASTLTIACVRKPCSLVPKARASLARLLRPQSLCVLAHTGNSSIDTCSRICCVSKSPSMLSMQSRGMQHLPCLEAVQVVWQSHIPHCAMQECCIKHVHKCMASQLLHRPCF